MSARAILPWVAGAALAGLLVLLGLVFWGKHQLETPYAGWPGESVVVQLEPGLDAGSALRKLAQAGVLEHPGWLRIWLSLRGGAEGLHAGEYRFDAAISPLDLVDRLTRGDVLLHPVTLPEGLTLAEVAQRLSLAGFGPADDLLSAFADPDLVRDIDPDAADLEGYLFPDTYQFPRGTTPERIAETLVRRFREVVGESYQAESRLVGLSLRNAVTLASLIEKETSLSEERSRISRVFHNRLERRMRLECDPTVIYALAREGREVKTLTRGDLGFDSPWNTYVVYGLPAGPIANPGRDSLLAAVRPAAGDEVYFVAAPDGGHRFSETLDEHLRAVEAWRRYKRSSR